MSEDANKARAQADQWIKNIDPAATTPQRSYAVVAHNAPTDIWIDAEELKDAIDNIEEYNLDNEPDGCQIANLAWLNNTDIQNTSKPGPLMISYQTKTAANAAIENGLVIEGVLCSVTSTMLLVPRLGPLSDGMHGRPDVDAVLSLIPQMTTYSDSKK